MLEELLVTFQTVTGLLEPSVSCQVNTERCFRCSVVTLKVLFQVIKGLALSGRTVMKIKFLILSFLFFIKMEIEYL